MTEFLLIGLVIVCCITILTLWSKLDTARADLKEAHEQVDEDEVYIAELREDLKLMEAALVRESGRVRAGRKSGIINRARGA